MTIPEAPKQDAGKVLLQELNTPSNRKGGRKRINQSLLIPLLAVFTGLIVGAIFIILTTEDVYAAFGRNFFEGIGVALQTVGRAYGALFIGAFGDPGRIISAIASGDGKVIAGAFNPLLESLVATTPYIFGGLALALGFRSGVFNIGAEGQIFVGALTGTFAGYAIQGLPAVIHIPLAMLAGAAGGALWGFIPGWLKAKTGGHEVINTIMMNYVAFRLSEWLLTGPMMGPQKIPVSPPIEKTAWLPQFFGSRFHLGFFIALGIAYLVYWFLFKTTWGFNLRTVGANPNAGRYAGMNTTWGIILAMTLSGALAGLAGATEVLGVNHNLAMAFSSGYGFDSIALALLGNNTPGGVVLASLLFGFLRNGATQMQVSTNIPNDIISILQAVILMFIAAPAIIRTIFRLRAPTEGDGGINIRGWGGS